MSRWVPTFHKNARVFTWTLDSGRPNFDWHWLQVYVPLIITQLSMYSWEHYWLVPSCIQIVRIKPFHCHSKFASILLICSHIHLINDENTVTKDVTYVSLPKLPSFIQMWNFTSNTSILWNFLTILCKTVVTNNSRHVKSVIVVNMYDFNSQISYGITILAKRTTYLIYNKTYIRTMSWFPRDNFKYCYEQRYVLSLKSTFYFHICLIYEKIATLSPVYYFSSER